MTLRRGLAAAALGVIGLLLVAPGAALAKEKLPDATGYVVDTAHAVPDDRQAAIEGRIAAYVTATGKEIAVAVVPTTGSQSIEDYANDLFDKWGVGQKDKDTGVLIVIAMNDRKLRIEVGYGVEGDVTDAEAAAIIRDELTPQMRAGDVASAITGAVEAVIAQLGGDTGTPLAHNAVGVAAPTPTANVNVLLALLPTVLILGTFIALGVTLAGRSSRRRSGGWAPIFVGKSWGSSWSSDGGGFSSGGGGGFGGFSGGSSGGGGASGGW